MIQYTINNTIGTITLNRPNKAHAYTQLMLKEFESAWHTLSSTCRVIIICSKGHSAFCAGADLNEMKSATTDDAFQLHSQFLFEQIAQSSVVTIAAVHGPAIAGGFELTLACDLRVIGPQAFFSLPEVSLGLIPSAGGCTRLQSIIGPSKANAIILGGDKITADQALDWGIANRLVNNPLQEAQKWATEINSFDPMALRLAKRVLKEPSLERERLCEAILYSRKNS
jgi:enoyl-CoA hydratase